MVNTLLLRKIALFSKMLYLFHPLHRISNGIFFAILLATNYDPYLTSISQYAILFQKVISFCVILSCLQKVPDVRYNHVCQNENPCFSGIRKSYREWLHILLRLCIYPSDSPQIPLIFGEQRLKPTENILIILQWVFLGGREQEEDCNLNNPKPNRIK